MVLSDDISSLKVEMNKLAVAVELLTLRMAAQGKIDISKFPWYTPHYVVGDSIRLPGTVLSTSTTHVVNGEMGDSSSAIISKENNALPGAHQMFEEIPEPSLSATVDQVAVVGDDHSISIKPGGNGVPEPYIDAASDYVRTAHKLFHTMPVPDFILEMAKVAKTTQEKNEERAGAHQLLDTIPELIEHANVSQPKGQAEAINNEIVPRKVFDELPLPDFIKKMAESSKVVELNSTGGDYENALAIREVDDDHSFHKQSLFAKLGALDGSYLHDLVIINGNKKRFSMLQSLIIHGYPLSDQMPTYINTDYAENLCLDYPHFQVSIESCITLYRVQLVNFVKNDMWLLLSTLEDKGVFRGEEDANGKCTWKLLNHLGLWSKYNASRTNICFVLLSYIFDPGGFAFCVGRISMVVLDDWFVKLMLFSFKSISTYSMIVFALIHVLEVNDGSMGDNVGVEVSYNTTLEDKGDFRGEEDTSKEYNRELFTSLTLRSHFSTSRTNKSHLFFTFVFDPGDNVNSSCGCKPWQVGNVEFKSGVVYGVSSYNDAATICLDGYIKLVSFIFGWGDILNHHRIREVSDFLSWSIFFPHYKFKASEMKKEFIWDPGIIAKIAYWTSNVLRVGLCKGGIFSKIRLIKLWAAGSMTSIVRATNFDNFEDVSKSFIMSEVPLEHWFIAIRTMLVMKSAREDSTVSCKFPMFMIVRSFVFYPGEWEYNLSHVESLTSKFVQTTKIIPFLLCCLAQLNLLQSSEGADREVAILVFDPGGYGNGNGQKVHRLKAYQNGGNRFSVKPCQDYQSYVFDPGGSLMPVNDAMVTNPRPGMCYALAYFKYHLSLILEDKDRFKGRVLIHIKNETKGSLVIYPLCFLFPKSLVAYIRALVSCNDQSMNFMNQLVRFISFV